MTVRFSSGRLAAALLGLFALVGQAPAQVPLLKLEPNDRIAIVGNTLAERMQHEGSFEALIYALHPEHNLTIRNLGFSADELTVRLRSANFGSLDQWLSASAPIPKPDAIADRENTAKNRFAGIGLPADVVLMFFGYNESFGGEAGLPKFRKDLETYIDQLRSQKYNGRTSPRLAVLSPIGFENHKTRYLPDGAGINANLKLYTAAMKDVAAAKQVPFVDLFAPSLSAYETAKDKLTINGIHLNDAGNKTVAEFAAKGLFPTPVPAKPEVVEATRLAVVDKNFYWFQRYRATDGYSVFGERAFLKFVAGQTNYEVGQRELEVIDTLIGYRDVSIRAAAQGRNEKPKDSNLPPFVPVVTNKPGTLPGGKHLYQSGQDAIGLMTLGKNIEVNLFADETMFPEMVNPHQFAWDAQGRLWVATWPTYPHWKPTTAMNDKLVVLEDTNGDGKADKSTVFADDLHNITGFEFYNGGVIVAQAPDIVFLKDTNGDGKYDVKTRLVHGMDTADTHHTSNSFVLEPGGAIYFQEGTFHHTQVESPYGPARRNVNGGVYRYDPRKQKFDVYVTYGFANPHGHVFDKWGQDIVVDATGANPYHAPMFSGYLPFPDKHNRTPQVYQQRTRPCGGLEYLSSSAFPEEFRGNLMVTNCIGFLGIMRYKIEDNGGTLKGTELEPILVSTDPNFRPVDVKTGPDGAIYVCDWQNPIIGHMQHNLRDPSRDREHGRIYRITYKGMAAAPPVKVVGEPVEALLNLLKHTDDGVRRRVRIELASRKAEDAIPAAKAWASTLDATDKNVEHHRLEALWLHQSFDEVDLPLLKSVLKSPDFHARAAAVRVLVEWRDRVPEALALLKVAGADAEPRVRLEAVRGASYFATPEAVEVVLTAQEVGTDAAVDHVSKETLRTLDPLLKSAIAKGETIRFTTPAGVRYLVKSIPTEDLVKLKRTFIVNTELLSRAGVRDEVRREAVAGLAMETKTTELQVLIGAIKSQDKPSIDEVVAYDLARLLTSRTSDLAAGRAELEAIARTAKTPLLRRIGFVALISADGSADKAWEFAAQTPAGLLDLVTAVPQLRDPNLRAALYPKLTALVQSLPEPLAAKLPKVEGIRGRFVRIELPGKQRTLTLAEVEVMSDGKNVARVGKAIQHSTTHGGNAERAIDGNKSGAYADGGQTHTREGVDNAWWQVDLGSEVPIDAIVVYNRTDSNLSDRLKNFTVVVLDKAKKPVFAKINNPSPAVSAGIAIGGDSPERQIRAAAMLALTGVRGKEGDSFRTLAGYLKDNAYRAAAVTALQRIPADAWPKDDASAHLKTLADYVAAVPSGERTAPAVVDALQLADALAGLLPRDQAKAARKTLGELGVRVIRVGTLTDQMAYDKDKLVVQAGKPVEFVIDNTDIMPHNFVIVQPGSLEEVGNAAEVFGTTPGAQEKQFLPPSNRILLGSKLLQPRESQTLRFEVPTKPGVYPYVCTYPGHWRRMFGALYVVADVDDYLADPEAYLAKNPMPISDELLKFIRPRTEWTFAELAPAASELATGGRSFSHGKQLFTVATCVSCHKFDGQGQDFGPDLTKLDEKVFLKPEDLLKHLLEPSLRIEDKYRSYTFNLETGAVVTGMVLEKSPTGDYKVIENPLAKAEARLIRKADLAEEPKVSAVSIMPKGLLDKLTKDEILDLMAYILAKGDPKHKLFTGGHGHK